MFDTCFLYCLRDAWPKGEVERQAALYPRAQEMEGANSQAEQGSSALEGPIAKQHVDISFGF